MSDVRVRKLQEFIKQEVSGMLMGVLKIRASASLPLPK